MCSPVGISLILSVDSRFGWRLTKIEDNTSFLQTVPTERDVSVVPPHEIVDQGKYLWLLLAATYGLINANAKWQRRRQSHDLLTELGLVITPLHPHLFLLRSRTKFSAILAIIVHDLLLVGFTDVTDSILAKIIDRFQLEVLHTAADFSASSF